jgi:hypothetical protein
LIFASPKGFHNLPPQVQDGVQRRVIAPPLTSEGRLRAVLNTNLAGANQFNFGNLFQTYGGTEYSVPTPLTSASLVINGKSFTTNGAYFSDLFTQDLTAGSFQAVAYAYPTPNYYLYIPRFNDSPKNRLPWGDFGIRHGA